MVKRSGFGAAVMILVPMTAGAQETGCAGTDAQGVGIPKPGMVLTWEDNDGNRHDETILTTVDGFTVTYADFGDDFLSYLIFYKHEYIAELPASGPQALDADFPANADGTRGIPPEMLDALRAVHAAELAAIDGLWPLQEGKTSRMSEDSGTTSWTVGRPVNKTFADADAVTEIIPIEGEGLFTGLEPAIWTLSYSPEHCIVIELQESYGHDTYGERVVAMTLP